MPATGISNNNGVKDQYAELVYQDHAGGGTKVGTSGHPLNKGKSEVQAFSKKLQRRDLNLIPPSAAIV